MNPKRWLAVVAVGISVFLSALDGSIVALALPPLGAAFHLSNQLTSIIVLAYAVPLTLLILPAGRLAGRYRALPQFLTALGGFAAGTALCGVAPSFGVLVLGRVIQGAAAALISTLGFAVAAGIVAPGERGRAVGIVGSLAPLGAIAGPGIGGVLLAHFSWSSVFFVNLPVCAAAAVLAAASLGQFRLGTHGQGAPASRMGHLLREPRFLGSLLGFLASVTIASGLYYLLPFDLGGVQHLGPSASGSLLLCVPLGMAMAGFLAGFLTDRFGPAPFTMLGSAVVLAGLLLLGSILTYPAPAFAIAWRLVLLGVGMGLFNSPSQAILMSVGGRQAMGTASALSNLSARIGSVLGPLSVGILWSVVPGLLRQMRSGGILILCLSVLAVLCAGAVASRTGLRRQPVREASGTPVG